MNIRRAFRGFALLIAVVPLVACDCVPAAGQTGQDKTVRSQPAEIIEDDCVRLFGIENPGEVLDHFQRHRIAVAAIDHVIRQGERRWLATLVYPSVNFDGEGGGSTVWYSHEAAVVAPPDAEVELAGLDWQHVLLVLAVRDEKLAYDLLGTARRHPRKSVVIDWFADKPELLYRGETLE